MSGNRIMRWWLAGALAWGGLFFQLDARAQAPPVAIAGNLTNTAKAMLTNSAPGAVQGSDLLQFVDGSSLHGQLRSMKTTRGVGWAHPDARGLIEFQPTNIAWIRFEKPK